MLEALDVPRRWRGYLVSRLIPPQIHPVSLIYKAAARLVARGRAARNAAVVASFAALTAAAFWLAQSYLSSSVWGIFLEAYLLKLSFSETQILYPCASAYGLDPCPRDVVQQFVRRDLSRADCGHVASACLETAAESLADSFVSPLFWYAIFGLPGAWVQRVVNTLDGLIGFRDWGISGAPAAYLDTAVNWIPARIAAGLILASAYLSGLKPDLSVLGDRSVESPNARWPISAVAASLRVRLEKPGSYAVGVGDLPDRGQVRRGLGLMAISMALYSAALMSALYLYGCVWGTPCLG
ncbi:MAG: CobD/CbiB family cobalamin biosynthesis protein [Thermoproteus sp.]